MRRIVILIAALILAAQPVRAGGKTDLEVFYSVYLSGIPLGSGVVNVSLTESGFVADGSAKTAPLIRIFSKSRGSVSARGSFHNNRIVSSMFSGRQNTSKREVKIDLKIVNGVAKDISIDPPLPVGDNSHVPITQETRTNVVDPLSAALILVPAKSDPLNPDNCNRSIPVFDGRYRFDVALSFARIEKAMRTEGYEGPALVCQIRYVPIAGHRADGTTVRPMVENRDMYIWIAPVAGTRVLAPIKAAVTSPLGTFVLEATRFRAVEN